MLTQNGSKHKSCIHQQLRWLLNNCVDCSRHMVCQRLLLRIMALASPVPNSSSLSRETTSNTSRHQLIVHLLRVSRKGRCSWWRGDWWSWRMEQWRLDCLVTWWPTGWLLTALREATWWLTGWLLTALREARRVNCWWAANCERCWTRYILAPALTFSNIMKKSQSTTTRSQRSDASTQAMRSTSRTTHKAHLSGFQLLCENRRTTSWYQRQLMVATWNVIVITCADVIQRR